MKKGIEATPSGLEVSVVVPVYRNADTLPELHRRLCRVLESHSLSFELLFVDDACPTGSLAVLEALAQSDPRVAALALDSNVGQHRAVLAGLAQARGRWMVVLDADLQDPPEAIPGLLVKGQQGFAAVFGGRHGRYESWPRLFTSRMFKALQHLLSGVPADAGMFVALSRPMAERLLAMSGAEPSMVAMMGCTGLPLASIPVTRAARPGGASAYSFWGRVRSGWRAFAWVLAWRWRTLRRAPDRPFSSPVVKAFVGARFAPTQEEVKA